MGDIFSYQGFKETQSQLQEDLIQLENFCESLKMDAIGKDVETVIRKAQTDTFNVAILGEFKRGKSTLINGLLGQKILPADPLPCSATLNRITYGVLPSATINFKDGTHKNIEVNELEKYVTKLSDESLETASTIEEAVVSYPLSYCKNNVDIIDTPGLNDDENMTRVTLSVIPQVDVSIFAIMALSPFGQYEKDFLENKLMTSDIGKIIFTVTRMDLVDEDDREKVIAHIRRQIEENILKKAKKVYGEGSEQYKDYIEKLGNIKVIGISPLQALKGKMKNNDSLIEQSNYPEFEKVLERMLLEDRGIIQLGVQINKISSTCAEIVKTVAMYDNCAQMDAEEFNEKYESTMASIKEMREQRENEVNRLKVSAEALKTKISPMIDDYWAEAERNALDIIDDTVITNNDLKKKENMEALQSNILDEIGIYLKNSQYILSERVQHLLEEELGKEMELIENYETGFMTRVTNFQKELATSNDHLARDSILTTAGMTIGSVLIDSIGGAVFFPAMFASGAIKGYKQEGVKGALKGAAGNLVGGVVGSSVVGGITTALMAGGVALTPFIAIPLLALGGLSTVLGGKLALSLFGNKSVKVDEFRNKMKDGISANFSNQRKDTALMRAYTEQIDETYKSLIQNVNDDTERILKTTETTLEELKKQKLENEVIGEQKKAMMADILRKVNDISERAKDLSEQIAERSAVTC